MGFKWKWLRYYSAINSINTHGYKNTAYNPITIQHGKVAHPAVKIQKILILDYYNGVPLQVSSYQSFNLSTSIEVQKAAERFGFIGAAVSEAPPAVSLISVKKVLALITSLITAFADNDHMRKSTHSFFVLLQTLSTSRLITG